jgi:hypothetical protein
MATLPQGTKLLKFIEDIPDEQLQRLYGSGLLTDLLNCPNPESVDRETFQRVLANQIVVKNIKTKPILELVGTVAISATAEKFVVKNYIKKLRKTRKVYTGSNFEERFFNKTVDPIDKSTLRYHKLLNGSVDKYILAELGGNEKAETILAEMFASIELQPNGEDGALLTNGYANIFYIRDDNGVLWAVYCRWRDGGWRVLAYSVEFPNEWDAGNQVFSRNTLES